MILIELWKVTYAIIYLDFKYDGASYVGEHKYYAKV